MVVDTQGLGAAHTASAPPNAAGTPSAVEVELLTPEHDTDNPLLSIVVPALNEQLTIEDFISWCQEGLQKVGVAGEILIVDSSTDRPSAGSGAPTRTPCPSSAGATC
jgi:hypothetical protein